VKHGAHRRLWPAAAAVVLAAFGPTQGARAQDGVRLVFTLSPLVAGETPRADHDARFAFTLTTGADVPLRGAKIAAWMVNRAPGAPPDERRCRSLAAAFLRGTGLAVPAVDLNAYYVLSLGGDASIAVIDPRLGFGGSHLIGLATLDASVSDWALTTDQTMLAAAVPGADQVALVDAESWEIRRRITVPHPRRLALAPGGRVLLASYRSADTGRGGGSGVAIIDLAAPDPTPVRVATGEGEHDIVLDSDGRFAFVSNSDADSVTVIDVVARQAVATVHTGHQPTLLAYSPLARRAYAAAEDGSVTAIGGPPFATLASVAGPAGIAALRFTPDGRFGLVASPEAGQVAVIDAATDAIVQRIDIAGQPDAIAFTDRFTVVRHRANEFIEAFPLAQIGGGRAPTSIRVAAGRLALGAVSEPSRADAMAAVPEGDGLMIANAGDREIYFYQEGMSAPSGSVATYGREPRAVRIVDRRLRESEPGVYRTIARLPRAGTYDLVLYVDAPRLVQCREVKVAPEPGQADAARTTVAGMALLDVPRAGHPLPLQFRLVDAETGIPVNDVDDARVLSFRIPGNDAGRSLARPLGDGAYAAEVSVPTPGRYYVFVEAPSVALAPTAGRIVTVAPAAGP